MSSTIDSINGNIEQRFDTLNQIAEIYNQYDLDENDQQLLTNARAELSDLSESYFSSTVCILKEYYTTTDDSIKKELHNDFVKAFHSANLIGKLKRIWQLFNRLRRSYEIDNDSLVDLFKTYEMTSVDETFVDRGCEICVKCNKPYDIEEKNSEFICKRCGLTEKMKGAVFEDEQFFYQEGQRTKHCKYDPIKHAKFWTDRIQAKESTEIPEKVINAVKKCIRRDQLWIENITCEVIRGYLKQLKMTIYNNHVPLIRKIITGKEPPQFSDHELRLLYMYFSMVTQVFNKIKSIEKSNCPYHPFFIYKIVEQILNNPKDAIKRREILSCIHLQSRYTLIENDKIWFMICDYIPEFTKIATDSCKR